MSTGPKYPINILNRRAISTVLSPVDNDYIFLSNSIADIDLGQHVTYDGSAGGDHDRISINENSIVRLKNFEFEFNNNGRFINMQDRLTFFLSPDREHSFYHFMNGKDLYIVAMDKNAKGKDSPIRAMVIFENLPELPHHTPNIYLRTKEQGVEINKLLLPSGQAEDWVWDETFPSCEELTAAVSKLMEHLTSTPEDANLKMLSGGITFNEILNTNKPRKSLRKP